MHIISRFMRFFFHHFYHSFAWTYDFVAAVVSIGRWNDWIQAVLPFVEGKTLLEIGPGTGILQNLLGRRSSLVIGLDESMQMIHRAKKRLKREGHKENNLTRGLAQMPPFPNEKFDSVISTFPSEYVFDPNTLIGIHRILKENGRFIVLPAAWIGGKKFLDKCAAWLFHVTGETPTEGIEVASARFIHPLMTTGFQVEVHQREIRSSNVVILVARKNS